MLRILFHNNGKMSIAEMSRVTNNEVDTLLPQVNAAETLKLVRVVEDEVIITKLGKEMNENKEAAIKEVSERLKKFEPFHTAYMLSKERGKFTTQELEEELEKRKIAFHADGETNKNILNTLLFQWAVYFSIVDYYGLGGVWVEEKSPQ